MSPPADRSQRASRRQVGALCWRDGASGREVLLVTSRETGRWIIPKGGRMSGVPDAQAAAQEALEEAGVTGDLDERPAGTFHYEKRLAGKARRLTAVDVYPLRVQAELDRWDEAHERTRQWFPATEAAQKVDEPELQALIRGFAPV
ncbi:NUDIX hydrolase [Brevundimonas sp.]|uniref:NUDIX hydrolase n=1 Tax=Brevundimonas sp. TaxID=1871086 RepID=UPI0025E84827|nr:NUDIX hydrolase [Brevundimonas sp.]